MSLWLWLKDSGTRLGYMVKPSQIMGQLKIGKAVVLLEPRYVLHVLITSNRGHTF